MDVVDIVYDGVDIDDVFDTVHVDVR